MIRHWERRARVNKESRDIDHGNVLAWIFFGATSLSLAARTIHGEWEGVWYTLLLFALSLFLLVIKWREKREKE